MTFSNNLRGDLAKLSDAELAARLEQSWSHYETTDKKRRSRSWFWTGRRTAELPLAVRIWLGFYRAPGFRVIALGFMAIVFNGIPIELLIKDPKQGSDVITKMITGADADINEIQAITKEIKRRVAERKASS